MNFFDAVWAIFSKDLRVEIRSKEIVLSTALFALLVVLLSAFAFGLNVMPGQSASAGVLWIAISFSGILAINRSFERERAFSVWSAILMTPTPRSALFFGKMLGILSFLIIVELALIPAIELFFHAPMLANILELLPILILGTIGYAAVGTIFGAMTVRTKLRDLLLGVIMYPLVSPILIMAVKATTIVIAGEGLGAATFYIKLLVVIDTIFLVGGMWLFGPLMED